MLASFGIPDDVVMHFTDSVVIESPNEHYTQHRTGAVLEFADFKRFLVADGQSEGATYWFDARVRGELRDVAGVAAVAVSCPDIGALEARGRRR